MKREYLICKVRGVPLYFCPVDFLKWSAVWALGLTALWLLPDNAGRLARVIVWAMTYFAAGRVVNGFER